MNPPPRRPSRRDGPRQRPGDWTLVWLASASVLLGAGAVMFGLSRSIPMSAPTPPAVTLGESPTVRATLPVVRVAGRHPRTARCGPPPAAPAGATSGPLPFSAPVEVAIPAICVRASVIALGENPDGTARVPPLSEPQLTSWFDDGPAPGETGPAALYGHVDTAAAGPAVFFRLDKLVPGDTVDITRVDHRVAVFTVYRVAEYHKIVFPTMTVYGDTPGPELRLITCGGVYDAATGSYLDNIVAYARLTAVTST